MKQRQIIFRFLFPSRQDAAKAVHPAMCSFYNPTTSLETSLTLNGLCLFTTRTNVSCITKLFHQFSYLTRIISLIQRHTLRLLFCRFRTLYRNTLNRCLSHLAVMPIRPINRQANWHARCFGKQTAFNTFFGPVRRVWAGFFPRQAGPWSWHHPSIAMTSQYLSTHHNLPRPSSKVPEKPQLRSTPEILSVPYCWNKYRSRSTRSIDSQFAIRKKYHPLLCDPTLSACRLRSDGYSDASVSMVRFFPIIGLKSCICFLFFFLSSLNPFKGIIAFDYIGHSGVIRIGSKQN